MEDARIAIETVKEGLSHLGAMVADTPPFGAHRAVWQW